MFYAKWYPKQWMPVLRSQRSEVRGQKGSGLINRHLTYAAKTSKRLARTLFHAMLRYGPKLEREQVLLGRFVEIGAELFAITATCLRAERVLRSSDANAGGPDVLKLADYFCQASRLRIEERFRAIRHNADRASYRLAQDVLNSSS
jgi:hypothetical protein